MERYKCGMVLVACMILAAPFARAQEHVIEVLADKDSRYKIAGERTPEITVKAGEQVLLRITARRGKSWNRDGSIHGFSLLRAGGTLSAISRSAHRFRQRR